LFKNIGLLCQWSARLELLNISIIFYFDFFLLLVRIFKLRSRPENHPDPTIRLNGHILKVVNTHRILGLIMDRQLTWRPHIETMKAKCSKRLNLLRHLAGTQCGVDQSTLLRIHKMLVLLAVEFGSAANRSARKIQ
jgi:hypothetical protein